MLSIFVVCCMPNLNDILDHSGPPKQPIRSPLIWVLDVVVLSYATVLFVGTFLFFAYSTYRGDNMASALISILLIIIGGGFYWMSSTGFFVFWRDWYKISTAYDKTLNIDLLARFYPETRSALLPSFRQLKTSAESVRYSSLFLFSVGAILLLALQKRINPPTLFVLLALGFMAQAILAVGYCFVIHNVIGKLLQKHQKN